VVCPYIWCRSSVTALAQARRSENKILNSIIFYQKMLFKIFGSTSHIQTLRFQLQKTLRFKKNFFLPYKSLLFNAFPIRILQAYAPRIIKLTVLAFLRLTRWESLLKQTRNPQAHALGFIVTLRFLKIFINLCAKNLYITSFRIPQAHALGIIT
jgi:hypothetical protein